MILEFEYDPAKSDANKAKHGIDFKQAQQIWNNTLVKVPMSFEGEARHAIIGTIEARYWTAIVTYRAHVIRIISVRRARKKEVAFYEQTKNTYH
jgi:uncharacterized DUF497 family protein